MWMQLGEIQFEGVFGPEIMESTMSANYAEHALTEGKPRLQRLGSKLTSMSMGIRLHRQFSVPENTIAELSALQQSGSILPLITGAGDVYGDFVITDISQTFMRLAGDGSIIEVGVQLTLKEYSTPDRSTAVKNAARKEGFALEQNNPVPAAVAQTTRVEGEASQGVTDVGTAANAVKDSTKRAASVPAQEPLERKKMELDLRKILSVAARVRRLCDDFTGDMFTNTRNLDWVLAGIIADATGLLAMLLGGSAIASIQPVVDGLMLKVRDMKAAAAFMNSVTASRR